MAKKVIQSADIAKLAAAKQAEVAKEYFDYGTVTTAISKAAGEGKQHLRILQNLKVTLKETPAAKHLCERLERGGFGIQWEQAGQRVELEKNGSYELIQYEELTILWGADYQGGIAEAVLSVSE